MKGGDGPLPGEAPVFHVICAVRISARDTLAEAEVEAQYNWEQFGLLSHVTQKGHKVATHDGVWRPLIRA